MIHVFSHKEIWMTLKWMIFLISCQKKRTIHALQVLNESEETFLETKFGIMSPGSVLSYQCSLVPADSMLIPISLQLMNVVVII